MQAIVRAERVAGINTNEIEVKRNGNKKIYTFFLKKRHIVANQSAQLCVCVAKITIDMCMRDVGHTRNELMAELSLFHRKFFPNKRSTSDTVDWVLSMIFLFLVNKLTYLSF